MLSELTTRKSVLSDYAAIEALLRQLGYETASLLVLEKIETLRRSPTDELFVATVQGKVVGSIRLHAFMPFYADGYLGSITSLVVDERVCACGVGSALIAAAERWFEEVGCVRSEVTSANHRLNVHRFLERYGFLSDGHRFYKEF